MKCTPHSESRRQLMRDYLLAEARHTPHHNLQLVQFTVMCWVDLPLPFPRLLHKHHISVLKMGHITLDFPPKSDRLGGEIICICTNWL